MGSCDEEMDEWYASWSVFLKKYSTSLVANRIKAIQDSAFKDFKDFPRSSIGYDLPFKVELQQIEALRKKIAVTRNIISFGTLLCAENQEPLAISAAHLAQCVFSNMEGSKDFPNDLTSSMLSALLLKFNPLLHVKYTLALPRLKHLAELCDLTLDLSDYPFTVKMEYCVVSLLSTLLEMLQLGTRISLKELQLYERLRLLRVLLKRHPDRFSNHNVRNITAAIVCDSGVRIFSFYRNDSETQHWLQSFLENSEVIWGEVLGEKVMETSTFNFPKTNILGFLDFLLEDYLMEVNSSHVSVSKIREHLVFLKIYIGKLVELSNQEENLHQDVWNLAVQMAFKIEFLIDQLVLGDVLDCFSVSLQSITEYIVTLKAGNILDDLGRQEIFKVQNITSPSSDKVLSISSTQVADQVVGLESEKALIVNRLLSGFKKLHVVAIVGMAGLGKTTLAKKVYSGHSISSYFHIMARCCISQVFDKRNVLLELLNQVQPDSSYSAMNENDLSQKLWRSLRKRRYLIFIDDIWDTKAFDLLKESLPDDSNQSRILLTSRHSDVVPEALLDEKPLILRHLTMDESMELLQRRLFPAQKDWPSALHELGMEIAEYCKGLPLTIVIIAGLLRNMERDDWKDVGKTMRSSFISDVTDQCESTIELSYRHLPEHLKPCFLWFGAFPEDHEFSVKELILLWIAEGLVRKSEIRSVEDVAARYLKNLIGRSLVTSVQERSIGGVKACRIHDLLHDFCLKKSKENHILHLVNEEGDLPRRQSSFDEPDFPRRLCMHAEPRHLHSYEFLIPRLRSLSFFTPNDSARNPDVSFIFRIFKLLRVLKVGEVYLEGLPSDVGHPVQLRYLEIQVCGNICQAIGQFSKLETLIIYCAKSRVVMPDALWKLRKLRHLYSKHGSIVLPIDDSDSSCKLLELENLSGLYYEELSVMEKQLRKFPNIRRINCWFQNGYVDVNDSKVVDFSFLRQLESLSFSSYNCRGEPFELIFSDNIKKLTLWGTKLQALQSYQILRYSSYSRNPLMGRHGMLKKGNSLD